MSACFACLHYVTLLLLHPYPFVDLFASRFFCDTVSFLDATCQLVTLSGDYIEIVVR